jgi:hypothetical protein
MVPARKRQAASGGKGMITGIAYGVAGFFVVLAFYGFTMTVFQHGEDAGVAAERERCAKICDMRAAIWRDRRGMCSLPLEEECEDIADAIRMNKPPDIVTSDDRDKTNVQAH